MMEFWFSRSISNLLKQLLATQAKPQKTVTISVFLSKIVCRKTLLEMAKKVCHNCHLKCGKGKIDPETQKKIDEAYKQLQGQESKSLLKKYLTCDVFDLLRDVQTPLGSTLLDCIQSGKCYYIHII